MKREGEDGRGGATVAVRAARVSVALAIGALAAASPVLAADSGRSGVGGPHTRAPQHDPTHSVAGARASTDRDGAGAGTIAIYDCRGRNHETYARVYGSCQRGTFAGPDDTTGSVAFGRCVPGGAFEAVDSATAQKVTGQCDSKPRPAAAR